MPVPVGRSKVPVGEKMGLGRNWEIRKWVSGIGFDAEEMGGMKMVLAFGLHGGWRGNLG
jgi:hypothetical protein